MRNSMHNSMTGSVQSTRPYASCCHSYVHAPSPPRTPVVLHPTHIAVPSFPRLAAPFSNKKIHLHIHGNTSSMLVPTPSGQTEATAAGLCARPPRDFMCSSPCWLDHTATP